ncbi:carcinoembryonic antigen-related cell adhesion molecule 3-like isoform X2 [Cricetulus griseus]|uniref:Carcinoembryonic antigen-related cell adhesion molecule 3-like isoform X2 n=1 Tax=Cricetulus griseus TaxID=10029 RepID=A0A9J7KCX3_CRIGR|nr:carcinoembryonic antigen-related cell adhesion molecule 3-like isoform X2 [Cricetulus griseus]
MEMSSVLLCNGCIPWQGLLLTASLLACWHFSPTTAQVTIESVPPQVVEGENVLLLVHNLPENLAALVWFKGVEITDNAIIDNGIAFYVQNNNVHALGPFHSGRETMYRNGSLWIRNVTQADTGVYTLGILSGPREILSKTSMYLHVYSSSFHCGRSPTSSQPTIESVPSSVAEGTSVLLVVHNLPENLGTLFWYKGEIVFNKLEVAHHIVATNSTVLGPAHSGREIVYSNGSLLLQNVTWNDTGFYTLRTLSTDLKDQVARVLLQLDTCNSAFHCGHHLTFAQPTIESVPPRVAEGGSALLIVHNLPKNIRAIFWYKGVILFKDYEVARHITATNSSVRALAHSGRETMYSNGSLLLQNVTRNDAEFYTLRTLTTDLKVGLVHVKLLVDTSHSVCCNSLTSVQLMIEPVPQNAVKGDSVLFLVHNLPEDLQGFTWYKSVYSTQSSKIAEYSRVTNYITQGPAYSGRAVVYANGSLLLQDVMERDAGFYTLQTLNRDFKTENAHVQLNVYTCRLPPTNVQLSIETMPPHVVEGKNALLLVHNIPENLRAFSWSKEVTIVSRHEIARKVITANKSFLGPVHSSRVTVYPNGSLLLQNTTQEDSGYYTLRTLNTQFETQETHVYLHIYKPVTQPFIQITSTTVTAQSSVVLTCHSRDTGVSFSWNFNSRSLQLTERMTLSPTKYRLRIDPVRREDAGKYQCVVFNPVSSKTSLPVSLVVINE